MKNIKKIINFIAKKAQYYILTFLNYIIPKSQHRVFIYDKDLKKDNVWAIACYLSSQEEYNKKYQVIYYTKEHPKEKDTIKFISNPLEALWNQLRSSYVFYSYRKDIKLFKPVRKQKIIDTMHGSPLKTIGYLKGNKKFNKLWRYQNTFSHILCTSDFFKDIVKKCYGASEEQCIVLGYPRNDEIFKYKESLDALNIDKALYQKIILWMPTYRSHDKHGVNEDSIISFPLLNQDNIVGFNEFLSHNDILIIIKPHPNQLDLSFLSKEYSHIKIFTNQNLAKVEVDLYQLLGQVDALLSDYSSVYFDFLLTQKPIGFVIDDIEHYGGKRGFVVEDPFTLMPGDKIYDLDGLTNFLKDLKQDKDDYNQSRKSVNDIANKYQDGNSSKRVVEFLNM